MLSNLRPMSLTEVKDFYDLYNVGQKGLGLAVGCSLYDYTETAVKPWLFTSDNISNILMVSENNYWDSLRGPPSTDPNVLYIILQKSKYHQAENNALNVAGWQARINSIETEFNPITWWGDESTSERTANLNQAIQIKEELAAMLMNAQQKINNLTKS